MGVLSRSIGRYCHARSNSSSATISLPRSSWLSVRKTLDDVAECKLGRLAEKDEKAGLRRDK